MSVACGSDAENPTEQRESSGGALGPGGGQGSSGENGESAGTCSKTIAGTADSDSEIPVCCTPSAAQKSELTTLFDLLNAYRAENGRAALVYDDALESSIQAHCEHMRLRGFFDHMAPEAEVKDPFKRATLCGTTANAENIAAGQATPAAAMTSWKKSSGHNANMLGNYKRVGLCRSGDAWGQIFGK